MDRRARLVGAAASALVAWSVAACTGDDSVSGEGEDAAPPIGGEDATIAPHADGSVDGRAGDGTVASDATNDVPASDDAPADTATANDAGGDAPADAGPDTACPSGEARCDGGCVPVEGDNANCGACGATCEGGTTCIEAGCVAPVAGEAGATCDPTARAAFPAIATASGVYLVEGIPVNAVAPLATTAFVGIDDAGLEPDACSASSGVSVPVAEYGMGLARAASSVYLVAGITTAGSQGAVYRAAIADGGLGAFGATTLADGGAVAVKTSRYGHAIVQKGKYVYALGGWSGTVGSAGTTLASIERAEIDPVTGDFVTGFDVAIDPATSQPATLAVARLAMAVYVDPPWVYLLGGQSGVGTQTTLHDEIQRASFDANDALSSFTQVGTLATPAGGATAFAAGGTLYVLGGATAYSDPNYTLTNAVQAASIASDGTLGSFAITPLVLPYAQCCGGSVTLGSTVYLFEGLAGNGFAATTSIESLTVP